MLRLEHKHFWDTIRTMPVVEAEQMLKEIRADVSLRLVRAREKKSNESVAELCALNTVLNVEIHRIAQINRSAMMTRAIRNLWGEEGHAMWREEIARLESLAVGASHA